MWGAFVNARNARNARNVCRHVSGGPARLLHFVCLVVFICVAADGGAGAAQLPVTDAALETASAARTVRVRVTSGASPRIVDLPLEQYVARVLAGEGEPNAPDAAQQALAIAIRTYAAANAGKHGREGFDLCDTTHCQVVRAATPASRAAALATAGRLLTYRDRAAEVFYSASCGGRTEAASQVWRGALDHPYLREADDDVHGGDEPWILEVPLARVEQALRRAGFDGRRLTDVRIERRSASGRAVRLHLAGMRPDAITGEDFRAALGARDLRSTAFTVKKAGRQLRFTGRGYGHGVGLCVIGAGRRAARGESAAQILAHYYPGLQLRADGAAAVPAPAPPGVGPAPGQVSSPDAGSTLHRLTRRARIEIAAALGVDAPPDVRVVVHESLEAFRHATGQPWWVSTAVSGAAVDLPPVAVLAQRDGLERSLRRAVAEVLVAGQLADRPAWVRVGAARYFGAATPPASPSGRVQCPSDAELTMAVSATAHRDAEQRAEACFARAFARERNWRDVR